MTVNSSKLLEQLSMESRVTIFKALADPARLEILEILSPEIRCNCHLQDQMDLAPNLLSYHLKVLREAGLIIGAKRGRWVDYSLTTQARGLLTSALPRGLQ